MAEAQGVNVAALYALGIVEHIVDERPDAALEGRAFCQRLAQAIEYELAALSATGLDELLLHRFEKFRRVGTLAGRAGHVLPETANVL